MSRKRNRRGKVAQQPAPVLPLAPPKPRGHGGSRSKCTEETRQLVVEAILKGAGREDAAEAAGIGTSTLYLWLAEGRKQESGVYLEFLEAVEGAERQLVIDCSEGMVDLTREDVPPAVRFAALKLILQSRRSSLWRPAKEVSLSAPGGGPVQLEHGGSLTVAVTPLFTDEQLASMTPEQLRAAMLGLGKPT